MFSICTLPRNSSIIKITEWQGTVLASQNSSTIASTYQHEQDPSALKTCVSSETRGLIFELTDLISLLGKDTKWNWSKISLNNLKGWTNTEFSAEWDATVLNIYKNCPRWGKNFLSKYLGCCSLLTVRPPPLFFSVHSTIVSIGVGPIIICFAKTHDKWVYSNVCIHIYTAYAQVIIKKKKREKPYVRTLDWIFPLTLSKSNQFLYLLLQHTWRWPLGN